uniref:Tetraspanin n=1 Tax=Phallusia mammillata TaxID=59560 RepID=A0A6F9DV26_9ASCI|nr:tetraspanin-7 [Phallusia mammillata]
MCFTKRTETISEIMVSNRNMKTTPAITCLKMLLVIFTIIFCIVGIGILAMGVYSKVQLSGYILLSSQQYSMAPYVMIGFGAFIFLVGLIGCCATAKSNTCLLRTYGILLGVIFIAELVGAIAVVVLRVKISSGFQQGMLHAMTNYNITTTDYKGAVDQAQTMLKCCGATNYTDYWTQCGWDEYYVPGSCCSNKTACGNAKTIAVSPLADVAKSTVYVTGCHSLVFGLVDHNLGIIIGSMFGVAAFQLIGLILSCCLASSINSNKYELV